MKSPIPTGHIVLISYDEDEFLVVGGFESMEVADEWVQSRAPGENYCILPEYHFKSIEEVAFENVVDEALADLVDNGLVEWVGVAEDGQPTFTLTADGKRVADMLEKDLEKGSEDGEE